MILPITGIGEESIPENRGFRQDMVMMTNHKKRPL